MALEELTKNNEKEIEVIRIDEEKNRAYVLARSDGGYFLDSNLHCIEHDLETGEIISENVFREKYPEDLKACLVFSLLGVGIPFLIMQALPSVRERRRKTINYLASVELFKKANRMEFEETSTVGYINTQKV